MHLNEYVKNFKVLMIIQSQSWEVTKILNITVGQDFWLVHINEKLDEKSTIIAIQLQNVSIQNSEEKSVKI